MEFYKKEINPAKLHLPDFKLICLPFSGKSSLRECRCPRLRQLRLRRRIRRFGCRSQKDARRRLQQA